jgi:hypothetical protein
MNFLLSGAFKGRHTMNSLEEDTVSGMVVDLQMARTAGGQGVPQDYPSSR